MAASRFRALPRVASNFQYYPISTDSKINKDLSAIKSSFRDHLKQERIRAIRGGGEKRIQKQHNKGSLTSRERLSLLFDSGSFVEVDQLKAHRCTEFGMNKPENNIPGDGVVVGHGLINGKVVFAFSQDFTCFGGKSVSILSFGLFLIPL